MSSSTNFTPKRPAARAIPSSNVNNGARSERAVSNTYPSYAYTPSSKARSRASFVTISQAASTPFDSLPKRWPQLGASASRTPAIKAFPISHDRDGAATRSCPAVARVITDLVGSFSNTAKPPTYRLPSPLLVQLYKSFVATLSEPFLLQRNFEKEQFLAAAGFVQAAR